MSITDALAFSNAYLVEGRRFRGKVEEHNDQIVVKTDYEKDGMNQKGGTIGVDRYNCQ